MREGAFAMQKTRNIKLLTDISTLPYIFPCVKNEVFPIK